MSKVKMLLYDRRLLPSLIADTSVRAAYSFDEPDAFDTPALVQCLQSLKVSPVLSCACIASA